MVSDSVHRILKSLESPISFLVCLLVVICFIIFMDSVEVPKKAKHLQQPTTYSLLNLTHFQYIINNQVCGDIAGSNVVHAIIIITSHAGNTDVRHAHRLALPKHLLLSIGVRRVFLLAVYSKNSNDKKYIPIKQKEILRENMVHGDLIQGNFNEAYRNLTYKHMMGLHWVYEFCEKAKFVIKMDDDIILDIFQLLKIIPDMVDARKSFLLGYVLKGMKPIRDPHNKWYVSEYEYPKSFYPPFLSGWMYVTTPTVVSRLINASMQNKSIWKVKYSPPTFFWVDDVFVTGILAHQAGVMLVDFSKYFAVHPQYFQCCIEAAVINSAHKASVVHEPYFCEFVVGPSGGDMILLRKVLKDAENCWSFGELCRRRSSSNKITNSCIVGRGEAFDLVRRPFSKGQAILKPIRL